MNQIKICTVLIGLMCLSNSAFTQNNFYAVCSEDNLIRLINLDSGAVLESTPITLSGDSVIKSNGIAVHPLTGVVYVLLTIQGQPSRELAMINTSTGTAVDIGDTGDKFADISFASSGTLFGITGDGASTPETLYTLDLLTGAASFVMTLGNGSDGEVIAYNPDNELLYHASGLDEGRIFESIDPLLAVTDIPYSGNSFQEATALLYTGNGSFVMASWNNYYHITTSGSVTSIDNLNFLFNCKGLIQASPPSSVDDDLNIKGDEIKIYPNPNHGKFTILVGQGYSKEIGINIFDMKGKVIFTKEFNSSNEISIDLSNNVKGTYLLQLVSGMKTSWKRILIE